jgi:hypothetical protein
MMVMSVVMVAVVLVLLDRSRRTITAIEGQVLLGMAAQERITALPEVLLGMLVAVLVARC